MDQAFETTDSANGRPWLLGLKPLEPEDHSRESRDDSEATTLGLPSDTLGLALSGQGIRGAAFSLGVLQALAKSGWLRHVDYLSTVAGGGYAGGFLGRYFDSLRGRPGEPQLAPGVVQERVARDLIDPNSAAVGSLRRHSNYLAPGGAGDEVVNLSVFLRSTLAVYLILGVLFLAVFGIVNAIGYGPLGASILARMPRWVSALLPISARLPADYATLWLVLAEAVVWVAMIPLILAYLLTSSNIPNAFAAPILLASAIVAGLVLLATGNPLAILIMLAAVLWSIEATISTGPSREEGPGDPFHPYRRLLAREHLNRGLAFWLSTAISLIVLGNVDALGRWLARLMLGGGWTFSHLALWLGSAGAIVSGLDATLRVAGRLFRRRTARVTTTGPSYLWATLSFVLGVLPALVAFSFLSHSLYHVGEAYLQGLLVTVVAVVLSLLLGAGECVTLLNQTGTIATQAGRLSRTFLGATNTSRRVHPEGQDVTRSVLGDNVPFGNYRPDLAGGPLHLINCALNETFDVASFRATLDRQAENLAAGPAGISVARFWHALWHREGPPTGSLNPTGQESPDPFLGSRAGPIPSEPLDLEDWMAISGTSPRISPDHRSTLAFARTGYWWDSGRNARDRLGKPIKTGFAGHVGSALARVLKTQTLLLSEFTGRFGGPWPRHWYLGNGADFEGTAAYELLRRRLPFLIICDAGDDPGRVAPELTRITRLARIDFGAEITEVDINGAILDQLGVPKTVAENLCTLAGILSSPGQSSRGHATLLRIHYPDAQSGFEGTGLPARRHSWVLYLKATITGDEPAEVRGYAATHPGFPNETVPGQVFDEPCWESYRRLGEHIGDRLFDKTAVGST